MSTDRHIISTDELQRQQLLADENPDASEIETTTGNVDSSYSLPKHEQHLMHLKLTKKEHDPIAKEYRTVETIWQGSAAQYERMSKSADKGGTDAFADYDSVELLHDVRPQSVAKAKAGSTPEGGEPTKKPAPRSLVDAQARYKELVGIAPPAEATFTEVKDELAHLESPEGAADLARLKAEAANTPQ